MVLSLDHTRRSPEEKQTLHTLGAHRLVDSSHNDGVSVDQACRKDSMEPLLSQHPAVGRQDSSPWPTTMVLLTLHGMGTVLGAQ